jgi:hypothetical protein
MDGACGIHEGTKKCIKNVGWKISRDETAWESKHGWMLGFLILVVCIGTPYWHPFLQKTNINKHVNKNYIIMKIEIRILLYSECSNFC